MTQKFTKSGFNNHDIRGETGTTDVRVVKLDQDSTPVVRSFEFERLSSPGQGGYEAVKSRYGALAATDNERGSRTQKDRRFSLSELIREPLSVEQEERRVIEEKVRARVAAMSEEAKAEAAAVGYEDGLEKGYQEAFQKFQQEGAERIAEFEKMLQQAESAKQEIFHANERFLVELVFRVARTILLRELKADKEYVVRLAREVVDRVGVRDNVTVKLNPEDLTSATMLKEGLEKSFGEMNNLNVEASSQVRRGGCIVETEWNLIDASIEEQLQHVYQALINEAPAMGGESA